MSSSTDAHLEPSAPCPSAETLMRVFVGDASATERSECARHLTDCEACAEVMTNLRPFGDWHADLLHSADQAPAPSLEGRRPRTRLAATIATWAAVVLATLGLAMLALPDFFDQAGSRVRGGETSWQLEPVDGSTFTGGTEFIWRSPRGPSEARLLLFDQASREIFRSDATTDGRLRLPDDIQQTLEPGAIYYWRIEQRSGIEVHPSPLSSFVTAPSSAAGRNENHP